MLPAWNALGSTHWIHPITGCARLNVTPLKWHTRPLVRLSDIRGSWHEANMGHFTYQHFLHKWTSEQSSRAENRTIRLIIAFRVFFGCPNSWLFDTQNSILLISYQYQDFQDFKSWIPKTWMIKNQILENPPRESILRICFQIQFQLKYARLNDIRGHPSLKPHLV